jgi:hypothetical protein
LRKQPTGELQWSVPEWQGGRTIMLKKKSRAGISFMASPQFERQVGSSSSRWQA